MMATGENNGRSKLSWKEVKAIRKQHANGHSTHSLAFDYDLSQSTVWGIVNDITWRTNDEFKTDSTQRQNKRLSPLGQK
jgi:hypothetical protein